MGGIGRDSSRASLISSLKSSYFLSAVCRARQIFSIPDPLCPIVSHSWVLPFWACQALAVVSRVFRTCIELSTCSHNVDGSKGLARGKCHQDIQMRLP